MKLTFSKSERLSSKKIIEELFTNGHKIYLNSFMLIWANKTNSDPRIEMLISVPKKKIIKSIDRSYIKRIIRESYRQNKEYIYNLITDNIYIALVYNKKDLIEFNNLEIELLTIFERLSKKLNENN
jgi:ribonuclease P protein component